MSSNSLRWESLCKVFETIQPLKRAEKKAKLNRIFEEHRKISGGDMYALMRLLLPQLHRDADRRTFRTGLKEAALAMLSEGRDSIASQDSVASLSFELLSKWNRFFCLTSAAGWVEQRIIEALALSKASKDAQRLKNWKQPIAGKGQGNFANVLEDVLKDRSAKKGSLYAKDVVTFLDDLQAASGEGEGSSTAQKQTKLFENILRTATALEMKWVAREILQEMHAGLSETLVLEVYHPDANELYKTNSNLQEVTEKLKDPSFRLSRINLELFTPCKSMLAEKTDPVDSTIGHRDTIARLARTCKPKRTARFRHEQMKRSTLLNRTLVLRYDWEEMWRKNDAALQKVSAETRCMWQLMEPKEVLKRFKNGFWMEPKYDGERLQVHKQGDTIRCFSRAGMEWTSLYCPLLDYIRDHRMIKADTCILDGELCGWHREKEQWNNFYSLKPLALKKGGQMPRQSDGRVRGGAPGGTQVQEQDEDMEKSQLVFICFDLLMLEGDIVVEKPLSERRDMLRALIHQEKYTLEVIEWKVGTTVDDAMENAEAWLSERLEGNILKDPTSKYRPGSRDGEWMKFKPDYSCGVEFDVVFIGASYGSNKRGGKLWQFVCGIADKPPPGRQHPNVFRSFCRVGTGMKEVQFTEVSRMLKPHLRTCNPSKPKEEMPSDSRVHVDKKDGFVVASWKASGAYADDGVDVYFSGSKREELDVIIDPRHSIVVTITADKRLIRSNVWMAARDSKHNADDQKGKLGWTLRFPRIKQVRVMSIPGGHGDKPWHECMTHEQLEQEIEKSEDLSTYKMVPLTDKPEKGTRKRKQEKAEGGGILKAARFHGGNFSKDFDLLVGAEVCVINGLDEKKDLEEKAARLGAEVVANPIPLTTTHIVAVTRDQKFKNHQKLGHDVIGHAWLSECWEQKRNIPLEPKYMLHTSAETLERFRGEFDKYGDCYSKILNPKDLQVLLQDPPNPKAWEDMDMGREGALNAEEVEEVEEALLRAAGKRRARGEDGASQTQSLDLGTQSQEWASLMDVDTQGPAPDGATAGFSWSLFGRVRAVCVADDSIELRVPGVEVAAACIISGGGSAVDGASFEQRGGEGNGHLRGEEAITHAVVDAKALRRLGEGAAEQVLLKLGLQNRGVAVVSPRWVLDSAARGELLQLDPSPSQDGSLD